MTRAGALAVLLAVSTGVHAQPAPRVTVDGEAFDGAWIAEPRAALIKGIPYAAPPVGPLRWNPVSEVRCAV